MHEESDKDKVVYQGCLIHVGIRLWASERLLEVALTRRAEDGIQACLCKICVVFFCYTAGFCDRLPWYGWAVVVRNDCGQADIKGKQQIKVYCFP